MRLYFAAAGYVLMVIVNVLANSLPINGQTQSEITNRLNVLFTPAGYVFSIWLLIYVLLGIWLIRYFPAQNRNSRVFSASSPWFFISCLLNSAWLFLWHYGLFPWSVIDMAGLLIVLLTLYRNIKKAGGTGFHLLPFSIYTGWISVALISNIAYTLKDSGWDGWGLSDPAWCIIMLIAAAILAACFRLRHQDLFYLLVFIWAFIGIGVNNDGRTDIQAWAYSLSVILALAGLLPYLLIRPLFRR